MMYMWSDEIDSFRSPDVVVLLYIKAYVFLVWKDS